MRIPFFSRGRMLAAVTAMALCLAPRLRSAQNDAVEFPHVIALELGSVEFAPGDAITITSLRGDRPHLEIGGRYLLEGSYTLASAETATLGWFITSRGPSSPTPVGAGETAPVNRGTGRFRLTKTFLGDGWPHVSFYVDRRSHGGVYFGETGIEASVLRTKRWSDFVDRAPRSAGGMSTMTIGRGLDPAPAPKIAASSASTANAAIMAYLGEPVPPPATLDARYGRDGLSNAFTAMCRKAGWTVEKLSVDDSEFPYLLYGLIAGQHDFNAIKSALGTMSDYVYGGSVVGRAGNSTFFALNITPASRHSSGQTDAIQRRLMVRLAMLADGIRKTD